MRRPITLTTKEEASATKRSRRFAGPVERIFKLAPASTNANAAFGFIETKPAEMLFRTVTSNAQPARTSAPAAPTVRLAALAKDWSAETVLGLVVTNGKRSNRSHNVVVRRPPFAADCWLALADEEGSRRPSPLAARFPVAAGTRPRSKMAAACSR